MTMHKNQSDGRDDQRIRPYSGVGVSTSDWLHPGAKVEVRIDEDGFRGAWYEAVVRRILNRRRCEVSYATLLSDDNEPAKPLVEAVRVDDIRPCPDAADGTVEYSLYDLVEAFHNDGWWSGVVSGVLYGGQYKVSFPTSREEIVLKLALIRPKFHWGSEDEEAEDSGFIVGVDVEVSRERDHFGKTWFAAQVKKLISNNVFLVEYKNIKRADRDKELLTEIVDAENIRPIQVVDLCVGFNVKDEVEVYIEGGWSPGVVTRILELSKFSVKLDYHRKEMEFNKSSMRPRCQWNGSDWVLTRKRTFKESGSGKMYAERRLTSSENKSLSSSFSVATSCNDSGATSNSNSHLVKRRKTKASSPRHQNESAKSSSDLEKMELECNGRLHDNFSLDGSLTECHDDQTIELSEPIRTMGIIKSSKREKKLDDNFSQDGVSKELPNEHQVINVSDVAIVPVQGTVQLVNDGEKPVHLSKTPHTDILSNIEDLDFVRLAAWKDSMVGQRAWLNKKRRKKLFVRRRKDIVLADPAHAEVVLGSRSSALYTDGVASIDLKANDKANMMLDLSKRIEGTCEKNDHIVTREEVREIIVRGEGSNLFPSKNMQHPFIKNCALWQFIESMEVFKKMPQQPHFQPLEKYAMEFREGLAIGLMISFANLVSSVHQLQAFDAQTTIEAKFELLENLEKSGFDVHLLRLRLEKLLEIQACKRQFESFKSLLNAKIIEKDKNNVRLDDFITTFDNSILEMKQKLREAQEKREALFMQRKKNEAEVCKMQKDVHDAENTFRSAARSFDASLAALW